MAYNDLSSWINAGSNFWPGTRTGNTNISVSKAADGITMKSISISGTGYCPATIVQPDPINAIETEGIKMSFIKRSDSASPPRFLVILMNKRIDTFAHNNCTVPADGNTGHTITRLQDVCEKMVSLDPQFGYKAYGFKVMNYLRNDNNTMANDISFNFLYDYCTFNNQKLNRQIYYPETNTIWYTCFSGGQPVDLTNCYIAICLYSSSGASPTSFLISSISEMEAKDKDKFKFSEDNGKRYAISRTSLKKVGKAIRDKLHTTQEYTPKEMVQAIYKMNGLRIDPNDTSNNGSRPFNPALQTEADKLYLFNENDQDFYCSNITGGWHIGDKGWKHATNQMSIFNDDGSLSIGSHSDAVSPMSMITERKFNIRSMISAGYKCLRLKVGLNTKAIGTAKGAHKFAVIFATQDIPIETWDTEQSVFGAEAPQYYLFCDQDNNIYRSGQYIKCDKIGDVYYISVYFKDVMLEKLDAYGKQAYIAIGTIKDDGTYVNTSGGTPTGGYYDTIHQIYFAK